MVGEAGGNVAMTVLFAAGTNVLAVFSIPLWFDLILKVSPSTPDEVTDEAINSHFDPWDILWKLALTILLPLVVGKILQQVDQIKLFVSTYKTFLKLLSSALLIMVPYVTMSQSALRIKEAHGLHVRY